VTGLRWTDVDFDAGTLRLAHALARVAGKRVLAEPKTERSRRILPLAHRDRQAIARAIAGEHWQERDFVFASTIGTPLQPRNILTSWHKLLATAGLPRRKFHVARHTAASLLRADSVPLRVVMELLGHSQISTTANTDGHAFSEPLREASDAMDRALGAGS
jgi:integrase